MASSDNVNVIEVIEPNLSCPVQVPNVSLTVEDSDDDDSKFYFFGVR